METPIDVLLALAQAGSQLNETEPTVLAALADTCWQTVDTANATLTLQTEQTVNADRNRLKQLFENLFRNAIEHGSTDADTQGLTEVGNSNPSVTIEIGDIADSGFYVADNGPGIPEDDRANVFESGYSTAEDGTGYGLAIVKEIVEAHGWSVTVTTSEEGGARFEIKT